MTDARMPERLLVDRRFRRLSDSAFRLYWLATVWSVSNRTDGVICDNDLPELTALGVDVGLIPELVKAEPPLWRRDADCWLVVDFQRDQTSAHVLDVLDNVRRRDREKKARQRARTKGSGSDDPVSDDLVSDVVPRDVPRDMSPGTTQDRTGQARKGSLRDRTTAELGPSGTRIPDDWKPSEALVEWQREQGIGDLLARRELPKFRDYYRAKVGPGALRADWSATWRNWLRNAAEGQERAAATPAEEVPTW